MGNLKAVQNPAKSENLRGENLRTAKRGREKKKTPAVRNLLKNKGRRLEMAPERAEVSLPEKDREKKNVKPCYITEEKDLIQANKDIFYTFRLLFP